MRFEDIYREHVTPVWRYVRLRVPSDSDAEDVTSQVFEKALRSWSSYDGGLALIALGVCAAAGAVSRRWSTVSVLTCTPLAIGFGLHGFTEVGVFAAGVALHAVEGICGVLLAVAWWWDRRDRARGS